MWGSSASDVFGVCYGGKIIHYDGSSWSTMESGTEEWLKGLWGSSASDVFTVGENGTILRYDGSAWSKVKSFTTKHLYGIWGTAADNIYAVGASGTILRFNGIIWSDDMASGTAEGLRAIWGTSGSDIFSVGDNGTIIHYDGATWSPMESNTNAWLLGVWGSSATDVYAVGGYYDGVGGWWSRDSWDGGVIMHFDGQTWSEIKNDIPQRLFGVWGSSAADIYAVGAYGTILRNKDAGADTCLFKNLYGEHSRQVRLLRTLRDGQLNANLVGSGLVTLYYEWSPFMIKMIKGNETARGSLKRLIDAVLPLLGSAVE